ncbi:MAG: hypothetical protein GWO16_05015 [Gammaproteobacteria bacterium]|nr:hypothetical protein [Gammaproteobacteria bacterium]NIR97441.1 hypothetical protein [Gammaproteobacteria bacterium]
MNPTLQIHTPAQHDYDNPAVETNPKRLAKWLKQLPLLDLTASVTELRDAIGLANEQSMPAKTRLRLLELYYEPVLSVFGAGEDEHLRSLPMSSAERTRTKEEIGQLCGALANGYKILVKEEHVAGQSPARSQAALLALYRAMEMTALGLLHSFRTYQVVPAFAYLDAHQLYAFARHQEVLDAPVVFEKKTVSETGPGDLYLRVMLLAVTDPFHLGVGAASKLFGLFRQYAGLCRTLAVDGDITAQGCFVVDLARDRPPVPCARAQSEQSLPQHGYILDVRPAMKDARQRLEQLCQTSAAAKVENEELHLLKLLVPGLEKNRLRGGARRTVRRETRIAVGIDTIHYFLATGRTALDMAFVDSDRAIQTRDPDSEEEGQFNLEPWTMVNESANGCLLASRDRRQPGVRIGDAVGIVSLGSDDRPRVTLAVARWMRKATKGGMEMGVEVIPGRMLPVRCVPAGESRPMVDDRPRGLFVPRAAAEKVPATLMLPKQVYSPDRLIEVHTRERVTRVRAGNLVMDTEHFDRFDFAVVESEQLAGT